MKIIKRIINYIFGGIYYKYVISDLRAVIRYFTENNSRHYFKVVKHVNKMGKDKILILAPHPDDEAIGMGGTLIKYLSSNSDVNILYMTDGSGDDSQNNMTQTELIEIRKKESKVLGHKYNPNQIFWDVEDTRLTNDSKTIKNMIELIDTINPQRIFLPSFFDRHFDHFSANKILFDALNQNYKPLDVFGYEIHDSIVYPNLIVDISDTYKEKISMVKIYKTPLKTNDYIRLIELRNMYNYAKHININKAGYAENFVQLNSKSFLKIFNNHFNNLSETHSELISHLN
jgi:LmbE family N-acetylglucosaminyl deacetylase